MRLFQVADYREGDIFRIHSHLLSFFRCYQGYPSARNGYVFVINIPFRIYQIYVDPRTFTDICGPRNFVISYRFRLARGKFPIRTFDVLWSPSNTDLD